jgi:integrase
MATLKDLIDGYVASRDWDQATLSRLAFWESELGALELGAITPDHVDTALLHLAERGRLHATRNGKAERTGRPLAASTQNRYISQVQSLFRHARRLRLLPRAFVPPTHGIEKAPEPTRHDRFITTAELARLVAVARLVDRRWGRMVAWLQLSFTTGLRKGETMRLQWRDVDLEAGTAIVHKTKSGRPHVAVLLPHVVDELKKLPGKDPDALVFGNRDGAPFNLRALWARTCAGAGVVGKTPHSLRHGCASALAAAGVGQAVIMQTLNHASLASSARYQHLRVQDRARIVAEVFGG